MENDRQQTGTESADQNAVELQKMIEDEKAKAERYLNNWKRAEADFDNYKKRIEQERNENSRFASAALILNLLPVLDDLDRAFKSLPDKLAQLTWTEGIRLIHRKLKATLEAQGVTEIKAVGETFDPSAHEAVGQAAGKDNSVIEEVQKGYKLHDRVIRPAFVIVGNGNKKEKNESGPSTDSDDSGG